MLLVVFGAMFLVLITKLYNIQIVRGDEFQESARIYKNTQEISAPRGGIYDRNGQPLAVNRSTLMIKINTANKETAKNDMLIRFVRLMNRYGVEMIDALPITDTAPREFKFNGSASREKTWKNDMGLDQDITADEAYTELMDKKFKITEEETELTPEEARMVLSLRQSVHLQRFNKNPVVVAHDVSAEACAAVEERTADYPGVYIDLDYLREYPGGPYVSHIIGYTRKITANQLEEMKPLGYTEDDIVGQLGIEHAFELSLAGKNGAIETETDASGAKLGVLNSYPAVPGNNVFLTLDLNMQIEIYHALERRLAEILIGKLKSNPNRRNANPEDHVTTRAMLASILTANNISLQAIMEAEDGSFSKPVQEYLRLHGQVDPEDGDYWKKLMEFAGESVEMGKITQTQLLLIMYEQGIIAPEPNELESMKSGKLNVLNFLVRMLETGQITPQMTNIQPCTGSVVVLDMEGAVLAAVTYPTYDNNELVNTFNYDYYLKLMNDPTVPMLNRPFQDRQAVGSTFKMITAVTGLENGIITPATRIRDEVTFTKAGLPYARCTSNHGSINVVDALAVSCNYFFYETEYRMGNTRDGNMLEGIAMLNEYMEYFGLASLTGVEIEEAYDTSSLSAGVLPISSPAYRPFTRNANEIWSDGDNIRTAIGQADNELNCGQMAKYTAALATGGERYQMHFLDKVLSADGVLVDQFEPVIEETVPMSAVTLETIRKGMLAVTAGAKGTARGVFDGFPIEVGGKTGTAQISDAVPNHTTFAAFAPYDIPEVAVYVLLPHSYQYTVAAPAAVIGRDALSIYFRLDAEPQKMEKDNTLVMN
ncbi:MAG: hypothetical protein LBS19_06670 [Clostridiales bacterium]|jgi:cell division protein FtsI/penicillin-binding protein 2|nr:hypothetical protein [Clostridiales bacterium]